MHIYYASSPNKIVEFRRTILSATPSKITATEAGYIEAKALRALAQWGEWIVVRELAHLIHIHSLHIATAGCQAFANTKNSGQSANTFITTTPIKNSQGVERLFINKLS